MTANRLHATTASVALATALSVVASQVDAQPREYMKKPSPEELHVAFFQNCPWSLEHVLDGALVRSRIRRKQNWVFRELVLFVEVRCREVNELVMAHVNVSFGHFVPAEPGAQYTFDTVTINHSQYSLLTGALPEMGNLGRQPLENSLRDLVDGALVDYLRANFDL